MKICMVIPTLEQGGMERVMCELANYAVKEGEDIYIICLFKSNIIYPLSESVKVIFPDFDYEKKVSGKLKLIKALYKNLKKLSPDVVLSFGEIFNSLTVFACKGLKIPVYISDRSSPFATQGRFNDLLKKLAYPLADGFIAQTELAKTIFAKKGYSKNIVAIANPLKKFGNGIKSVNDLPNEEKRVVLSIGRVVASKNHKELIDIFNEINKPDWRLLIVGGGPLIGELNDYIKSLNKEDTIIMVGASNNVDEWLAKADVFAYASLTEGFPNALSEAVAFPLPCIAYDCPAGPSDIIQNDVNGIIIPLYDKQLYKNRLEELMTNKPMRDKIRKSAFLNREKYSVESIGRQYLNFITSKI
jgi:GalNAc-alpha-(1->4)-GalNAc-alpha-(1->3)-diNAcBac-PP-undecaprenol alpha-1,4-N-acetyl-D-galactosaminyltransferase